MSKTAEGATIQLASGNYFDYLDPDGSTVSIDDIAIALGKICRFNGHCQGFYSVAEHSVYVSQMVPRPDALAGLLHDAAEAFMGDIPSPLKWISPEFKELEKKIEKSILAKFGIERMPPSVKVVDMIMLATEQSQIMPNPEDVWPALGDAKPSTLKIQRLGPQEATDFFLARYYELTSI